MNENPAPLSYRIRVEGIIDSNWSDSLAGLTIAVEEPAGPRPVSILTGLLDDQGALQGVLETLFMLNLPLLQVERCAAEASIHCENHQPNHKGA